MSDSFPFVLTSCSYVSCFNIKVLANCAGFAIAKEFDEMSMAEFERLLRVNTLGTAFVTRALLPGMKASGGGRILFTSSLLGQASVRCYFRVRDWLFCSRCTAARYSAVC